MKGAILVVLLLVAGYCGLKVAGMYKSKTDLAARVQYRLDFVDEASMDSVKQDLIHDAGKLGIALAPENIRIVYEDTDRRTVAQKLLEGRVAEFSNKQIAIHVRYAERVLGLPIQQEITKSKIKQVQVRRPQPGPEMKELLNMGD